MGNDKIKKVDFKVWDTKNKILTKFIIVDNMFYFLDKFTGAWIRDDNQERFKLMQNVGYKDDNGQEMYEGDVCVYTDPGEEKQKYTFTVEWYDEAWVAKFKYGGREQLYNLWHTRIIGNSYTDKFKEEKEH